MQAVIKLGARNTLNQRQISRLFIGLLTTVFFMGVIAPVLVYASVSFSDAPNPDFSYVNGTVNDIATASDGSTYIGGNFSHANPHKRWHGAPVDVSSNIPGDSDLFDSPVTAVISDNSGGWYVGGSFEHYGSTPRVFLVHILPDGSLNTVFNPDIVNPGSGGVHSLALSDDGTILFAGGAFQEVNGDIVRENLAAFNTNDGTVTSFDASVDSSVNEIRLANNDELLYVAGDFTSVNGGTPRTYLAAFDTADSTATSFGADLDISSSVMALELSSNEATLYIGGWFWHVDSEVIALDTVYTERNHIAAINTATSDVLAFDPNVDDGVYSLNLTSDGTTIYAGGDFTSVNDYSETRYGLAAFNTANSIVTAFDAGIEEYTGVWASELNSDESVLYVGGWFTTVNGGVPRYHSAGFNTSDGTVTAFDAPVGGDISAIALSDDGTDLYLGGAYAGIGGEERRNLLKILPDGSLDEDFAPGTNGIVYSITLSSDENTLYAGGAFTSVDGGTTRNRIAAFNTSNGAVTSFNPAVNNNRVADIVLSNDDSTLYIGGTFTSVGSSVTRNRVAAFDTADSTVTSFNPNANGAVNALIISSDDSTLYLGGQFAWFGGFATSRNRVAAFDTSSGTATPFNPNITGQVFSLSISSDESLLYVGGQFGSVNASSVTRTNLAAFDTSTSADAGFSATTNLRVDSLELLNDEKLFAGGVFSAVQGPVDRPGFAVFNTDDSSLDDFNPDIYFGGSNNFFDQTDGVNVIAFSADTESLYVGGRSQVNSSNGTSDFGLTVFTPTSDAGDGSPDNDSGDPTSGTGSDGANSTGADGDLGNDLAATGYNQALIALLAVILLAGGVLVSRKRMVSTV